MTRKVTVRARALRDANVNFVSIVDKGANRLPIRALKSEEKDMLNLDTSTISRLFTRKKAEPVAAAVGLIVKADEAQGYANALKAEGHETVNILACESDDVRFVTFKAEGEVDLAEAVMIDSGDKAVVIENGKKMFKDWGNDGNHTFAENAAANGFYMNVRGAMDTAFDGILNAMETAEAGTRPIEQVQQIMADLGDYVGMLLSNVPETAFKMEKLTPVEGDEQPAIEGELVTDEAAGTDEAVVEGQVADTVEEVAGVESEQETTAVTEGDAPVQDPAPAATSQKSETEGDPMQLIASTLQALTEAVNGIKSEVSGVCKTVDALNSTVGTHGESMEELTNRIAKTEKTAKQALEDVNGTVVDTVDEEQEPQQTAQKTERSRASNIERY